MTKHKTTPGPWTVRKAKRPTDGEYDYAIGANVGGRAQCIAEAFGRCSENDILPAEANARLIAAAPAMRDALWALDASLDLSEGEGGMANEMWADVLSIDRETWIALCRQIRAALALADGGDTNV